MAEYVFFGRDRVDYTVEGNNLEDVVNYNEYLVLECMRELYGADPNLCRCAVCTEDVFALGLNALPPRYIQVTSVRTYLESSGYITPDTVREKVVEALEKVTRTSRH